MGVKVFDLMQIHNLVDWKTQLATLRRWKDEGRIRYLGITHYRSSAYADLARIIKSEPVDFLQVNYSLAEPESARELLPLAADNGVAVIINRPFRRGALFDYVKDKPLPTWAGEFDCVNWAQFFLKFIVSHPAVTCAIPATSQVKHIKENMGACYGALPDADMRARMIAYVENL